MKDIKKIMITLALLITAATGAWAQSPTIYFQQDYATETVDWSTATGGRFTPIVENGYLTVNQNQRNNNGTTLTSTATQGKVDAGKDFTMTFNVKLGASTQQTATAFNIYDAANSAPILSFAEGSAGATAWKINGGTQTATVSAGGGKSLNELSWIFVQVTFIAGENAKTYLTLKDDQNNIIDGFDKTEIPTNSVAGGLGKMTFVTSRYSANFAIDNVLVSDVVNDAPSGPEVAWDKAEKTGTFTMPGGNVTLEPEYYPQAALTAAPTAINDVPATTDGAIVKAGTVATIGSTTTAQGTVMYYVSTTALDDAALLALAADKWTADVPTAEKLAQGQAYVYYYVRGNDSDTDEENFSDGDILAANALTVTIAAEPTYAVTFAEGTQDADKWTVKAGTDGSFQSLPLKGVKAGTKVKLKYDGDRSMLKGVKATSDAKPAATVKTITIAADFHTSGHVATAPEITIEYNEGEKWSDVAARYDWLKMYETYTVYYDADSKSGDLHTADGGVKPSDLVDPNKSYYWGFE